MESIEIESAARQPPMIVGPTVTLVYSDERIIEETDEEGTVQTLYQYTLRRFARGEYELVQAGSLPSGVEWDDALRGIERATLYDEADRMISKYGTDVPDKTLRQAWIAYKHAVRATQDAPGYPQTVEYPSRPERSRTGGGFPLPLYIRGGGRDGGEVQGKAYVSIVREHRPVNCRNSANRNYKIRKYAGTEPTNTPPIPYQSGRVRGCENRPVNCRKRANRN